MKPQLLSRLSLLAKMKKEHIQKLKNKLQIN